jgi:hypothetical protein
MPKEPDTCPVCGRTRIATDAADACPRCGAPVARPGDDVLDDDDEMLMENARAVEPPWPR